VDFTLGCWAFASLDVLYTVLPASKKAMFK
jgi:hypothetical protein